MAIFQSTYDVLFLQVLYLLTFIMLIVLSIVKCLERSQEERKKYQLTLDTVSARRIIWVKCPSIAHHFQKGLSYLYLDTALILISTRQRLGPVRAGGWEGGETSLSFPSVPTTLGFGEPPKMKPAQRRLLCTLSLSHWS